MILAALIGCGSDPPPVRVPPETVPTVSDTAVALSGFSSRLHPTLGSLIYAHWVQDGVASVHLEYTFGEGEPWRATPTRDRGAGDHEELLLGVPYGAVATWRIVAEHPTGTLRSPDLQAQTAVLPDDVPRATVHTADPTRYDAAPYFLLTLAESLGKPWYALIVDRQGRVVWAQPAPADRNMMHSRVARDGRSLLLDRNSFWMLFDGGAASTVDQTLLDGTVLHTFQTPGLHHPFTDLPDGSLAYGATSGDLDDEELVRVYPDGTSESLWDCDVWLLANGPDQDCMSNTLTYDADRDRFLFSFWTLESVVEIDGVTHLANRWFGHAPGSYAFDPPESAFWYQHGGYYTDAGTFLTSTDLVDGAPSQGIETVVREYAVDDATGTLREVWSDGVGEGLYGHQMGEALRLPNGNTLHNYGVMARLREVTPERDVVWDVEWPEDTIGHSTPITDLYALTAPPP